MTIAIFSSKKEEAQSLIDILNEIDGTGKICWFDSKKSFLAFASGSKKIDLVFIDSCLSSADGMEIAEKLRSISPEARVVFIEENGDDALKAFEVNALHYLLKPVSKSQIYEVFQRLGKQREYRKTLPLLYERTMHLLFQDEIVRIETQIHRTTIWQADGSVCSFRKPFHEVCSLLDEAEFLLIRKGVIVGMHYILVMNLTECILSDGTHYILSRDRKKEICEKYQRYVKRTASS